LKSHKDYYQGGTIPWLLSGEVSQGEIFEAKNFITEFGLKNSSAKLFPPNTVLVAMYGATAGQVGILRFEACTNQAVCGILPNNKTIPEYLFYCFLSKKEELVAQAVGGAQPNISQIKIRNTKIPVPSVPEQKHIVSILDEAFAAIANAKANAEQNLKNAKELFESYLQGVFERKGEGWENKFLGEVTNIQRGSSPRPKGDPKYFSKTATEFNWITISDISSYCEDNVLLQTREWLTEEGSKQSRFVDENEFIIAVSGSTTGKCCITGIKGFIYDGLAVVKVKKNILDPIFLLNYMMSLYSTINNSKAGAAFPNINTNYLNNLPITFPSLKAQQAIVRQLDALRAETQKLEAVYQKKIDDLEELKKSILQKAFAGELTKTKELSTSIFS
jgi:type I restriction enzyme S subunit